MAYEADPYEFTFEMSDVEQIFHFVLRWERERAGQPGVVIGETPMPIDYWKRTFKPALEYECVREEIIGALHSLLVIDPLIAMQRNHEK